MDTEFSYIFNKDIYSQEILNKIEADMLKLNVQHKMTDQGLCFKRHDYQIAMDMKDSAIGKLMFN